MLRSALVLAVAVSLGGFCAEAAAASDEYRIAREPPCRLKPHARRNLREISEILGRIESRTWGKRPSVVLVTLDTVRADRLGPYGYAPARTPTLDAFAAQAVIFDHAYSPSGSTTPSHASIFTGLGPVRHGVRDNGRFYLHEDRTTLAEILRGRGYATAAFTSAYTVDHRFGFDQGFQVYQDSFRNPGFNRRRSFRSVPLGEGRHFERTADETVLEALRWLRDVPASPALLWLHLFDAHEPYLPPCMYFEMPEEDYDQEIAYLDLLLGEFLQGLQLSGLWKTALVWIVGDHGQSLGQHGDCCHTGSVYDSVLRVPMLVRLPGRTQSRRVGAMVRTLDIVPTLLDLLRIPSEGSLDGRSIRAHLDGDAASGSDEDAILHASAVPGTAEHPGGGRQRYAVRAPDFKLIHVYQDSERVSEEAYDLAVDPREETPTTIPEDRYQALRRELDTFVSRARTIDPSTVIPLDVEAWEKLRALGYVE